MAPCPRVEGPNALASRDSVVPTYLGHVEWVFIACALLRLTVVAHPSFWLAFTFRFLGYDFSSSLFLELLGTGKFFPAKSLYPNSVKQYETLARTPSFWDRLWQNHPSQFHDPSESQNLTFKMHLLTNSQSWGFQTTAHGNLPVIWP